MHVMDDMDAKYCAGLMSRFANMGISQRMAESAVKGMVEKGAAPTCDIRAALPSLFPIDLAKGAEPARTLTPTVS